MFSGSAIGLAYVFLRTSENGDVTINYMYKIEKPPLKKSQVNILGNDVFICQKVISSIHKYGKTGKPIFKAVRCVVTFVQQSTLKSLIFCTICAQVGGDTQNPECESGAW